MAVGPSVRLEPDSSATKEWLLDVLVHEAFFRHVSRERDDELRGYTKWYADGNVQSRIAILASVRRLDETTSSNYPTVTDLLFYASCSQTAEQANIDDHHFQLWALPLSSDYLPHLGTSETSNAGLQEQPADEDETAKKSKLHELFDDASDQRKKAKRKGGAGISLAASRNSFSSYNNGTTDPLQIVAQSPARNITPTSVTGVQPSRKRAVLTHLGSTSNVFQDQSIEARNKQAVSRAVMACMRVFGMQQRRTVSRHSSDRRAESNFIVNDDTAIMQDEEEKDSEYKAVYHQVYKGTLFTFVSKDHMADMSLG